MRAAKLWSSGLCMPFCWVFEVPRWKLDIEYLNGQFCGFDKAHVIKILHKVEDLSVASLVSFDARHEKTDLKVFWYDTDFLEFESFDFIDHIL